MLDEPVTPRPSVVLPDAAAARAVTLGPDSVTWRWGSDPRIFLAAAGVLLLQVAHPTVGAGVAEHSQFKSEPWARFFRTLDYLNLMTYGGEDAIAVGRNVREMHKRIKGVRPDGTRYHALEPGAYAWVHATLLEATIAGHRHFARPMTPAQVETFYEEFTGLGRLLGVREKDLPGDYASFRVYYDGMISDVLERNASVDDVLATIAAFPPPRSMPPAAHRLWKLIGAGGAQLQRLGTAAVVGPTLRRRFGMAWSAADEAQFRALGFALRSLTPVIPRSARVVGPAMLRQRRRAIARNPIGPGPARPEPAGGRGVRAA